MTEQPEWLPNPSPLPLPSSDLTPPPRGPGDAGPDPPPTSPQEKGPRRMPSRLVVVETVYHQTCCEDNPTALASSFSRTLKSDVTSYRPPAIRLDPSRGWVSLGKGWLEEVGMLLVKNEGPAVVQLGIRTEKKDAMDCVPFALILPNESLRFHPETVEMLAVRTHCLAEAPGIARVSVTLLPE